MLNVCNMLVTTVVIYGQGNNANLYQINGLSFDMIFCYLCDIMSKLNHDIIKPNF